MVLPCTDAHNSYNTAKQTVTISQNSAEHNDSFEVCTPFCVCGSCVTAVVLQPTIEYNLLTPEYFHPEISNFYQSLKSDFYGAIWQPPQLV